MYQQFVSIGNEVMDEINDSKMRATSLWNKMIAAITKTIQDLSWMKASLNNIALFQVEIGKDHCWALSSTTSGIK